MNSRMFSVERAIDGLGQIVYDPCLGQTSIANIPLATGRNQITEDIYSGFKNISPKSIQRNYPVSICWSPIVACNLNCYYCLDDKYLDTLPKDAFNEIAGIIAQSSVLGVDISGGEPLLIKSLESLLERLIQGNKSVSLTTNGFHLKTRARTLKNCTDAIRVSLESADPITHDNIRGVDSFKNALDGIKESVKQGVPTQIHFVAMKSTVKGLKNLMNFCVNEGVYGVTVLQMLPIGEGKLNFQDQAISDQELTQYVQSLDIPCNLRVRIRTRNEAELFTVVRADGFLYRNSLHCHDIQKIKRLTHFDDFLIDTDGSA